METKLKEFLMIFRWKLCFRGFGECFKGFQGFQDVLRCFVFVKARKVDAEVASVMKTDRQIVQVPPQFQAVKLVEDFDDSVSIGL
jgi:hypothetical protein